MTSMESNLARLKELALVFLKLGVLGFGGPAAHIAMMEEEVVARRGWLKRERFLDLLGATNLIPGPNSTEMAIHLGYVRAGWSGLAVAGTLLHSSCRRLDRGPGLDLRRVRTASSGCPLAAGDQAGRAGHHRRFRVAAGEQGLQNLVVGDHRRRRPGRPPCCRSTRWRRCCWAGLPACSGCGCRRRFDLDGGRSSRWLRESGWANG